MARFDVYSRPGSEGDGYLIDAQADLLQDLSTSVVAPLLPPAITPRPARNLNLVFEIAGEPT